MSEKKQITISGVLSDLDNGMTRPQIQEKYAITSRELKALFQHPKLKGKKAKSVFEPSFEIVDDVEETTVEPEQQIEEPELFSQD